MDERVEFFVERRPFLSLQTTHLGEDQPSRLPRGQRERSSRRLRHGCDQADRSRAVLRLSCSADSSASTHIRQAQVDVDGRIDEERPLFIIFC